VRQPLSVRLAEGIAGSLRKVLPTPALRVAFRCGHQVMTVWWFITRPSPTGSKVVVTRGREILFIRLTYGRRDTWDIPGGTAAADETPEETAARELFEEVGLAGDLRSLGSWTGIGRAQQARLHGFQVEVRPDAELAQDDAEIAETRWFDKDDLPGCIAAGSELLVKAALRTPVDA
jgi:8-oxo-dGTP pyrophosphatase MutT (NUDIX family)